MMLTIIENCSSPSLILQHIFPKMDFSVLQHPQGVTGRRSPRALAAVRVCPPCPSVPPPPPRHRWRNPPPDLPSGSALSVAKHARVSCVANDAGPRSWCLAIPPRGPGRSSVGSPSSSCLPFRLGLLLAWRHATAPCHGRLEASREGPWARAPLTSAPPGREDLKAGGQLC